MKTTVKVADDYFLNAANVCTCSLILSCTTNTTSTTSGALIVSGGMAVACNLCIGGSLNATGNITAEGNVTIGDADTDQVVFGADIHSDIIPNESACYNLGSATQKWNCGWIDNINMCTVDLTSTTNSTSPTTGALVICGGLGVACDIWVGNDVTICGDLNVCGSQSSGSSDTNLHATGTSNATSTTTGSLQSSGGLGVVCDAWFGGTITVPTMCVTTCFVIAGASTTTISSGSNIELDATNRVLITDTPFRLASVTTTERNALTADHGDLVYNTTDHKVQAYANSAWVDLH